MNAGKQDWIKFLKGVVADFTILKQSPDGNPVLWAQIADQRIRIIQEADSTFSFWMERFESEAGDSGDELVVDTSNQSEELRLTRNVVEAFLKRRTA